MSDSISLIIPTYNRAHLIVETIDSALRQTRPFAEIIVVDDGSTDNTVDVLARYGNRITVIRSANCGVQAARNKGVDAATSVFVALCDSDDLLEPTFAETMGDWLANHPEINAAYANMRKFGGKVVEPDLLAQAPSSFMEGAKSNAGFFYDVPDLYLRLFTLHYLYATGCIFKKSFYTEIGGFDMQFSGVGAEDSEFTLRAVAAGGIAVCQAPLGSVRRHAGNDSADELHMVIGKAKILEYALQHHSCAPKYSLQIRRAVSDLRMRAANESYGRGQFNLAKQMFAHKQTEKMNFRFKLKKTITAFPEPLRTLAWRVTQIKLGANQQEGSFPAIVLDVDGDMPQRADGH